MQDSILEVRLRFSSDQISNALEKVLLQVQKPGRYVGGELNQVVKPWDSVQTRVALAFPDIYDIGLPNLGLAILYDELNKRPDCLAERVYSPWLDFESVLRQHRIPLYTLESKHAIVDFDILGISLPYESLYTNTLNLLDLAGLPLLAKDRCMADPLVVAGGHAVFNPEPMADFIDVFVIGEGEEAIHDIVNVHQQWKASGSNSRLDLLRELSKVGGVYIPSFYRPQYYSDGTLQGYERLNTAAPERVIKRIVSRLPPPPTHHLVPNIDVVHNRVAVEIMRGCTRGCRFCHAGMINRPVRERPVEQIVNAIEKSLQATGYEEVALLSLSSSDYSKIGGLIDAISERFRGQHLAISLPSLRIESFSIDLMEKLKGSRQGGFTLAPEAATERMRTIINKPISTELLLQTTNAIYARGWLTIKLYFMIGHPNETLEDVEAIATLCQKVLSGGRQIAGHRANLNVGISTFVPKPHTPFQWVACDTEEKIKEKQGLLRHMLRTNGIKVSLTDSQATMLEAWLSRGDRRLGEVVLTAWKNGAKFDAWQDQFSPSAWADAFAQHDLDPAFYTHRQRELEEILPWDHISTGVSKRFLVEEYQNSLLPVAREDCREACYNCGILPTFADLRRQVLDDSWKCPRLPQKAKLRSAGEIKP